MKKFGDHSVYLNIKNTAKNKYATILWKHNRERDEERFNISGGALNNLTEPDSFDEVNQPIELTVNNHSEDHRIIYEITPDWGNNVIHIKIKNFPQVGHSLITENEKDGFTVKI